MTGNINWLGSANGAEISLQMSAIPTTVSRGKLKGEAVLLTIDLLSINHLAFDVSQKV